jgi:hypothetical protein
LRSWKRCLFVENTSAFNAYAYSVPTSTYLTLPVACRTDGCAVLHRNKIPSAFLNPSRNPSTPRQASSLSLDPTTPRPPPATLQRLERETKKPSSLRDWHSFFFPFVFPRPRQRKPGHPRRFASARPVHRLALFRSALSPRDQSLCVLASCVCVCVCVFSLLAALFISHRNRPTHHKPATVSSPSFQ